MQVVYYIVSMLYAGWLPSTIEGFIKLFEADVAFPHSVQHSSVSQAGRTVTANSHQKLNKVRKLDASSVGETGGIAGWQEEHLWNVDSHFEGSRVGMSTNSKQENLSRAAVLWIAYLQWDFILFCVVLTLLLCIYSSPSINTIYCIKDNVSDGRVLYSEIH